jgi:hypothetical protein
MKAQSPVPFVKPITACTILERTGNGLVREIVHKGVPASPSTHKRATRRRTLRALEQRQSVVVPVNQARFSAT